MTRKSDPSKAVRELVAERDEYRCVRCGGVWHWAGFSIHHRHMRSHGFPKLNSPENLIVLCGSGTAMDSCHAWVHAHPSEAYEMGWLVHGIKGETDPALVPVKTAQHGWVYLTEDGGWTPCETPTSNTPCL